MKLRRLLPIILIGFLLLFIAVKIPPTLAAPTWTINTVDSAEVVGQYTSVALDSQSNPVISYYDDTNRTLKLAICDDAECNSSTITTVDSSGFVGQYSSLALNGSDIPFISYYDDTNRTLKLAACNDATCSAPTLVTVDSGLVGEYSSLALDGSGNPVISYYDNTNRDLKLAVCDTPACGSPTISTVDNIGFVGQYSSVSLDSSGNPVISYYDNTNRDLKLAVCNDAICSSPTIQTVDNGTFVGQHTSVALATGDIPVISYYDQFNGNLKLAVCDAPTCGSPNLVTVDSTGVVGEYNSLDLNSNDRPIISYYDQLNGDLKLATCNSLACDSPVIETVDSTGDVGAYTSLVIDGSNSPTISYYADSTSGDLKLARYFDDLDYGDAPETGTSYPTILASNGARHADDGVTYLGAGIDSELNGQPTLNADGDDNTGTDDEDGVAFVDALVIGQAATQMEIDASVNGYLNAWLDFNGDGDWEDAGEQIFSDEPLNAGLNNLTVDAGDAVAGTTYVRFRFTSFNPAGGLSFNGYAADGEVEDYEVEIFALDYGDAAAPFATLLADDGARHLIDGTTHLGSSPDAELDGQPDVDALGDDNNGLDDEDGVTFASLLIPGQSNAEVTVNASVDGYLNAWVDFNADNDWEDVGEQIFTDELLVTGDNNLTFNIPADAVTGLTYARFRFTSYNTAGALSYTGAAMDGEVEDYTLTITGLDYGDVPETGTSYPTTLANDGARHYVDDTVHLGFLIDQEPDGQPSANADGDDNDVVDNDEDGVTFVNYLIIGQSALQLDVEAAVDGYLNAWIDFNADGDWDDVDEQIFSDTALVAGSNNLTIDVPATAIAGKTYARFRFTSYNTAGALSYAGVANDGEVEDYQVEIFGLDYGDAPEPSYPTLLASDGARHLIDGLTYLGSTVDDETEGQPNADATGDGVDEDGVTFVDKLQLGLSGRQLEVVASVPGVLNAWVDWNADGDWDDADEQVFTDEPLTAGPNNLTVDVPSTATVGTTYARFRFDTTGGLSYTGMALDGEVEDYQVEIVAPDLTATKSNDLSGGDAIVEVPFTWTILIENTGNAPATFGDSENILLDDLPADMTYANAQVTLSAGIVGAVTCNLQTSPDALLCFTDGVDVTIPTGETITATFEATPLGAGTYENPLPVIGVCEVDFFGVIAEQDDLNNGCADTVTAVGLDFGDTPDPTYPTLLAKDGARHVIDGATYLGAGVDNETDGQPSANADGDGADEDGVQFVDTFIVGETGLNLEVSASVAGYLNAWIDWNADGDWEDANEQIFVDQALSPSINNLTVNVPSDAKVGQTFARFRFDTTGGLSFTGLASDGEVEDYQVAILEYLKVVTYTPQGIDVPANSDVVVTFNQNVDGATVTEGDFVAPEDATFAVEGSLSGQVDCTFTVLNDTVTCNADTNFEYGETVFVTLTTGLQATSGAPLEAPFTWSFAVEAPTGYGQLWNSGQALGSDNSRPSAFGDLDGDGDLDAFVANDGQGNRVYFNDSTGVFIDTGQSLGSSRSFGVSLGDVDGDGDLDALVSNDVGQAERIYVNDGTGLFTAGQSFGSTTSLDNALGDFDGDGDLDAFIGGHQSNANRVWFNDGTGTFTDSGQSLGSSSTAVVAVGDVDDDGDLDVFTANLSGAPNVVWLNDGTGTFTDSGQTLGSSSSRGMAMADLDGDGDLDVFVANANQPNIVWVNDGNGTFTDSGQMLGSGTSRHVELGDLDGDGDIDALVANTGANELWLNDGTGVFTLNGQPAIETGNSWGATLGDIDGDGDLDALFANANEPNTVWFNTEADLGDAPETNYPTTLANNGPYHMLDGTTFLGATVDGELDGQPSAGADGDGADEDGVTFDDEWVAGQSVTLTVNASATGFLNAWADYNGNGNWGDAGEQIFNNASLNAGDNNLLILIPIDAVNGNIMVRFRFDTIGGLSFTGLALDGEVEDYQVKVSYLDFGDAPETGTSFPTTFSNDGARHYLDGSTYLGTAVDHEGNGPPSLDALGDDTVNIDDEDGIFPSLFVVGRQQVPIMVNASTDGYLNAWVDFNADGDWDDVGEQILTDKTIVAGTDTAFITVPADAVSGLTFARFRFTSYDTGGTLSYNGPADDGEVEDYQIDIKSADYGDAPAPYPTKQPDGAAHINDGVTYLGTTIDSEPDGQPTANADGDGADEDGVTFVDTLIVGEMGLQVEVVASADGYLNAWLDWNADGDWDDPGEFIFDDTPLTTGINSLTLDVPVTAQIGNTYARFRFTSYDHIDPALYTGMANDGEVEDYEVPVVEPFKIVTYSPQGIDVPANSNVVVTFNQNVDGTTITEGDFVAPEDATFAVEGSLSGQVDCTFTVVDDTATCDPDATFEYGETVTVTLTTGIQATSGAPLVAPFTWSFDVEAPTGYGQLWDSGQSLGASSSTVGAFGDVDGDGDLDAFIANHLNEPNRVWFNNGNGFFTDSGQALGTASTESVALGDLDGDGDLDAFMGNADALNTVWLNNGAGVFTLHQTFGTSLSYTVKLGDLDGDGDLDAFVAGNSGQPNRVYFNDGNANFTDSGQTLGTSSTVGVDLGDLDDDGDLDAFVSNIGNQPNRVYLNNGSGIFTDSGQTLGTFDSWSVALGDLDNDGDLDAYVANRSGQSNRVYFNDGNANFIDSGQTLGSNNSIKAVLGDFDGDNDLDAIVSSDTAAKELWVNDGNGGFTLNGQTNLGYAGIDSVGVMVGDLDGDGDLDVMFTNFFGVGNSVWFNSLADLGDAPNPTYPTLLAIDGARHLLDGTTYLGATVDGELDGQPSANADGDDLDGTDDEDGVTFVDELLVGQTVNVTVNASSAGLLNAWIDFNADGDWADPNEQIFTDEALVPGDNALTFNVPAGAITGNTFARFRFDSSGGLSSTGLANDGEVEDYQVTVTAPDLTITKSNDVSGASTAGTPWTWTLKVANDNNFGSAIFAENDVILSDNLPDSDVSYGAVAVQNQSGISGTGTIECSVDGNNDLTCTANGGTVTVASPGSFEVTVQTTALLAGTYTNPRGGGSCSVDPNNSVGEADETNNDCNSDSVDVTVPEPGISKEFGVEQMGLTDTTTLTFTVTNNADIPLTNVGFSDTLPDTPAGGLTFTTTPISGTCSGLAGFSASLSTVNATDDTLSVSGFDLTAQSNCTVIGEVVGNSTGTYDNASSVVTADEVTGTETATDTIVVVDANPTISKVFDPDTIEAGATSTLTFTVTNPETFALTNVSFSDALPVTVAGELEFLPATLDGTCDDTGFDANVIISTDTASNDTLTLTGLTLGATGSGSESCTVTVDVQGNLGGTFDNVSSVVSSDQGDGSSTATDTLTVSVPKPTISKAFGISVMGIGNTTTLTFTIDNNADIALTNVSFSDVLPDSPLGGLIFTTTPISGTCSNLTGFSAILGTVNATNDTLNVSGFDLAAQQSCTVIAEVVGNEVGTYNNVSSIVTANETASDNAATDTIEVVDAEPGLSKVFDPDNIEAGATSTLTFTVTNPEAFALTGASFSDELPVTAAGELEFLPATLAGTCDDTGFDANIAFSTTLASNDTLTLTGLTLGETGGGSDSCTVTVVVQGNLPGIFDNVSSVVSSDQGDGSTTATDTLTVTIEQPTISKTFAPDSVEVGNTSTLTFTVANTAGIGLTNVNFSDTLPESPSGGLAFTVGSVGGSCVDTLGANAVLSTVNTTNDTLTVDTFNLAAAGSANDSCTVTVTVQTNLPGTYDNESSVVASDQVNGTTTATDTLTVTGTDIDISKVFDPATTGTGYTTTLTFTLTNPSAITLTNVSFNDVLPPTPAGGLEFTGSVTGTCLATPYDGSAAPFGTTNAANDTLSMSGITLGPNGSDDSCTVVVDVQVNERGVYENVSSAVSSDQFDGVTTATDTLQVWIESDEIPPVIETGTWTDVSDANASASSFRTADAQTDALTLLIEGNLFEVIYVAGPDYGTFAIEVDGTVVRTVDTNAATTEYLVISTIDYLEDGTHLARVYPVSGTVAIDAFNAALPDPVTPPTAPTPVAPSGDIFTNSPTYEWTDTNVVNVDYYELTVYDTGGEIYFNDAYLPSAVCAGSDCQATPDAVLVTGDYTWTITAINAGGSAVGGPMAFSLVLNPGETILIYPIGSETIYTTTPTFEWAESQYATWYRLVTRNASGTVLVDDWYQASTVCESGLCSFRTAVNHGLIGSANFSWTITTYGDFDQNGSEEWGPEEGPENFTTAPPAVTAPLDKVKDIDGRPTYEWAAVSGADRYWLYATNILDGSVVLDTQVNAADVCAGSCAFKQPTPLNNGDYDYYIRSDGPLGYSPWSQNAFTLSVDTLPDVATQIAPDGNVSGDSIDFSWNKVSNATKYRVYVVNTATSATIHDGIHFGTGTASVCGSTTCVITLNGFTPGSYQWWVQSQNSAAPGPWSDTDPGTSGPQPMTFTVTVPPVGVATNMQPAGAITNPEPAYTWTAAPNATQHRVYIHKQGSGLVVYDQILAVSDTCTGTDCQLPPGTGPYLENGSYEWLIQGQNSGGNGDWAGPVAFSLNLNPPGAPTLIQPADAATITDQDRLTYEWNVVNDASYYNLQIRNTGTGQTLHNVWYRGTDIGCTTTCTVRPEIYLVNGNYSWSVQTWGPGGIGGTATRTFAINAGLPGVATLISPSGTITSTRNPAFTFTAGDYTTWHHIVVTNNPDDGTVHYDMWHEASELGCEGGGTCTLDAGLSLFNGNYLWKVESYSPAGSTIWSADQSFKISFGG